MHSHLWVVFYLMLRIYLAFALAQFDTSNYALNLTREVTFSDTTHIEVGLGWHIINTKRGDRWHWHNGGTGGYRSRYGNRYRKKECSYCFI